MTASLDAQRAAKRRYSQVRRKQQAMGLPTTDLVDAGTVRLHIERLRAQGMGIDRIRRAAGIAPMTMTNLMCGTRGLPPAQRIRHGTAAKLLAVELDIADRARVLGDPTRRRLRDLVAAGWSCRLLANHLGMSTSAFGQVLNGGSTVYGATERAVSQLHERLRDVAPPAETSTQRRAVSLAQGLARRRGWSVTPNVRGTS